MAKGNNWIQDAAIEIYDLEPAEDNVGNFMEIIEKHCPFEKDCIYEKVTETSRKLDELLSEIKVLRTDIGYVRRQV